jgi:hypothetical protein
VCAELLSENGAILFYFLFSASSAIRLTSCFVYLHTGGEPGQSVTRVCDWNGAFILIFIRTFIRSALMGDWTDAFVYYRNVRGERDGGVTGVPAG